MKSTSHPFQIYSIFLFLFFFTSVQAQTITVNGVLPDKNAKTGTWTEWQTVKDESGNTIAQYRIRLKSVEKFIGNSVECKYKIEVKNLTDKTLITDLDYSYYQKLGANSEKKSSTIKGWINKKKTWLFEFSVFNDKSETDKSQADPCHNCDLSYKLIFSVSKY